MQQFWSSQFPHAAPLLQQSEIRVSEMVLLDRAVHIFQFVVWNCSLGTIDCKGLLTAEDKKGEKSLQLCAAKSPCKHQPDKKRKTSALWMELRCYQKALGWHERKKRREKFLSLPDSLPKSTLDSMSVWGVLG